MARLRLFLLLGLLSLSALAQERVINYEATDKSLVSVFEELEQRFAIHFAYAVDEVKDKVVTIRAEELELSVFLNQLLSLHQLGFDIVEQNFISITRKSLAVRIEVSDVETDETLPFATARINGSSQGYISNQNGMFEMEVRDPASTVLEISFLGYEAVSINVDTLSPERTVRLKMQRDPKELQEVVVKEYLIKGISIDDQASRIRVAVQEMEILPGLSERDILFSAQLLSGIGSADESAGGLNVRGSSRDNTFIYWNNIPVYQPAHYFGNISSFIPSTVGDVDIYKNYVPVRYGGASSGLLLIDSRKSESENVIVESNLNLTHGDLFVSAPFAGYKGQVSIGARRSFNDLISTPTFNAISNKLFEGSLTEDVQGISDDFEYNSQLIFSDLNLVTDFNFKKDDIQFSLLRSQSKLDYDSQDEENIFQSIQEHNVRTLGTNLSWVRRWGANASTEWSTSFADYEMDYSLVNVRRDEEEELENDLQSRTNSLKNLESRLSFTLRPKENNTLDVGYQFNAINADLSINEDFFFEEDFVETIESEGLVHGFFGNYFGQFASGLQLGAGVRFNHYEALSSNRLDRQLRLNYQLSPGLLLKSTVGVYHQYISSLKELDFVFSNTLEQNWVTADEEEEIPVLKNEQVVAGVLFTKGGWVLDVDAYIKRVLAPVAWNFGFRPEEGEVLISGSETIKGLDFMLRRRWKYYRAWLSYTFQDSEVSAVEERFPSGLNLRHQLQLSQTLNYKQFEFSLGYTIKSGLPFTNATGFERVIDEDNEEDSFFEINYETLNGSRLPNYQRVDVSAWYKFTTKSASRLSGEVGLSVLNVLNRTNRLSRTYSIEEDEDERIFLLRNDRKLIGITPNISVRLKF